MKTRIHLKNGKQLKVNHSIDEVRSVVDEAIKIGVKFISGTRWQKSQNEEVAVDIEVSEIMMLEYEV